jgi:hypothetical protein
LGEFAGHKYRSQGSPVVKVSEAVAPERELSAVVDLPKDEFDRRSFREHAHGYPSIRGAAPFTYARRFQGGNVEPLLAQLAEPASHFLHDPALSRPEVIGQLGVDGPRSVINLFVLRHCQRVDRDQMDGFVGDINLHMWKEASL